MSNTKTKDPGRSENTGQDICQKNPRNKKRTKVYLFPFTENQRLKKNSLK